MSAPDRKTAKGGDRDRRLVPVARHPGIYRRGDGYVIRFRDPNGRQRQRAARTLAEARRLRSELAADMARGEYRAEARVTFAEYAQHFGETYTGRTRNGIRAETLAEYVRDLKPATARFERMRLTAMTPADVRAYAADLARQFAPATVRRKLAPLRAMLATAADDGLIRSSPMTGLRLALPQAAREVEEDEGQVKALDISELARLVTEVPDGLPHLLVTTIAQTGVRLSEALGWRWGDLDSEAGVLYVRRRYRGRSMGRPKSFRSRRAIPIAPDLARALAAYRVASAHSGDQAPIFAGRRGGPLRARGLYDWLVPAAERAGVPWVGFHTLRHTAATAWLRAGVNIAVVSHLLGHADPGFTLRVYAHVLPTDLPSGETLAAAVGLPLAL